LETATNARRNLPRPRETDIRNENSAVLGKQLIYDAVTGSDELSKSPPFTLHGFPEERVFSQHFYSSDKNFADGSRYPAEIPLRRERPDDVRHQALRRWR
jgi:hypothetical protein